MREKLESIVSSGLRWLYPGMHVKRWLLLLLLGMAVVGLGLGYILRDIYYDLAFPPIFYYLTLQFMPRILRALLFGTLGLAMVLISLLRLNQSILGAFPGSGNGSLAETVYRHWLRDRGPKVVAIGGGTGSSVLLRGLKEHTSHITAVITVADDGGSSGRLRRELGVLAPGDIRQSITALADSESLMTKLFEYRFKKGNELDGHSFGNLFIAALAEVTGNFERAVLESSRVLAVQGVILPSTLADVTLYADLREEGEALRRVEGESQIPTARLPIERVFLRPEGAPALPEAVVALQQADMIILGPGSLYTSVMPNLLVEGIAQAIRASSALKVYVCNVATQLGETEHYSVEDHIRALEGHIGEGLFECVLANSNWEVDFPPSWTIEQVRFGSDFPSRYRLVAVDLLDAERPWRHDSQKLARALMELYHSR